MSTGPTNRLDSATDVGGRLSARDIIGHLCALVVAGFFLYAAVGKIMDIRQFAVEIGNYKMPWLDEHYLNIPAIILPWIESLAAICLIFPRTRKGAALVIGGLLMFFIYAVFDAAIIRDLKISCGCTGKGSGQAGWLTIGRNVLLLSGTLLSVYFPSCSSCCVARDLEATSNEAAEIEPA